MPPPSPEQRATALGRPAPPPAGAGGYKFLQVHAGSPAPVTYDPCRPIHVVIAGRGQPAEVDEMLREGLDAVSSATGLVFVIDGPTDERPVDERAPYQPDRYPGRWAPVLIAWSDPEESPKLASDVAGFAGSIRVSVSSPPASEYVSGEVVFDTPQLVETLGRRGGAKRVRTVIAHELGHLVGLDHVDDPSQIMAPRVNTEVNGYGDGDRRGLAQLGQGPCSPAI